MYRQRRTDRPKRQRPPIDKPIKINRHDDEGVIREGEAYTLAAFKRRLDLTDSAWWAMIKSGIPHKIIGKRKVILGKDVLAFLATLPNAGSIPEGESIPA
jgi:hypothetical protein